MRRVVFVFLSFFWHVLLLFAGVGGLGSVGSSEFFWALTGVVLGGGNCYG